MPYGAAGFCSWWRTRTYFVGVAKDRRGPLSVCRCCRFYTRALWSKAKPLQRYFAVNVLESPVPYNRLVLLSRLVLSCVHIDRSTSYEYVWSSYVHSHSYKQHVFHRLKSEPLQLLEHARGTVYPSSSPTAGHLSLSRNISRLIYTAIFLEQESDHWLYKAPFSTLGRPWLYHFVTLHCITNTCNVSKKFTPLSSLMLHVGKICVISLECCMHNKQHYKLTGRPTCCLKQDRVDANSCLL